MKSLGQFISRLAGGIIKSIIWIVVIIFFYVFSLGSYYVIMPDVKYRPFCRIDGKIHYIEGPLRPEYKEWLKDGLKRENFYYREEDGYIYISRNSSGGGNDLFPDHYSFFINHEHKYVWALSRGRGAGNTRVEPPKALADLIAKTKEGPYERGIGDSVSSRYFRSCAFKRAGAIWLEKLEDVPARN